MKALKYFWMVLPLTLIGLVVGCSREQPTAVPDGIQENSTLNPIPLAVGPAWESYIVSEAKYALNIYRGGGSNLTYCDSYGRCYAMSDWPYPQSDAAAMTRCIANYGSNTGPFGLWLDRYQQGGWCKFFADMVLYRCSYAYPGGHLFLRSGYSWSPSHSVSEAQPGWILQKSERDHEHTAIVVARFADGLDVIDANYIGGNGSYAIGRHLFTWANLSGYAAYRAHEVCQIVH